MLQKRSNTYYFRWVFPLQIRLILSQRELYVSLATSDVFLARAKASPYYRFVAFIKGLNLNLLTTPQLETLVRDAWKELERSRSQSNHERHHVDDLIEQKRVLYEYWNPLIGEFDIYFPSKLTFKDPQRTIEWEEELGSYFEYQMRCWDSLFKSCRIDRHQYSHRDQLKLLNELCRVKADDIEQRIGLALNGNVEPSFQPVATLPTHLKESQGHEANRPLQKLSPNPKNSPKLSRFWADFKAEKLASHSWKDDKSTKTRDTWFSEFLIVCGGDQAATNINRKDAVEILNKTRQIPTYWATKHKGVTLAKVPEEAALLSEKSVEDRMALIAEFFKWMVRCDHLAKSPFDGIKYQAKNQKSYATYSKDDLAVLFNLPPERISRNWQFWIPRLALFAGARQNEIAQLTVNDIREYQPNEWCISINDEDNKSVKSAAAIRIVPMHQALIEHGFLEHLAKVKQKGCVSLWPDLNPKGASLGQNVSHYWNDVLKRRHQIPSEPITEDGRRKVFHSLRRVFINNLKDQQVDITTIQTLVGHEPELLGVTQVYIDDITPSSYESRTVAVNKFSPGVAISWINPKPI